MRTFLKLSLDRIRRIRSRHKTGLLSAATHLASLLLLLGGGIGTRVHVKPYRLPGTNQGSTLLTYYAPGSARPVSSQTPLKDPKKTKPAPAVKDRLYAPEPAKTEAAEAKAGVGTAAESGLGEGDITIALQSYFPYPKPDLSALPHGTKGDVILNAVIDEHGKIAELTLVKGLGAPIDQQVIATVQQWTYTPAMRKGVPVPSEQELHFHYERG